MKAENVIAGVVAGILSPVLIPVGIVSGIMSLRGESLMDKWDRAIDKIHEWEKKKHQKYYSAKIKGFMKSGNCSYCNIGLRNEFEEEIDEIDLDRELLPADCKVGMVFAV